MIVGNVSQDNLISAPACNVWKIYRGPGFVHFVNKYLSQVLGTLELIKGDGGPGSVIRFTPSPGTPGTGYETGRFRIMDDRKRIEEIEYLEGGYLTLGFTCFIVRKEIIETSPRSSIVRTTFEYEFPEKLAELVSLLHNPKTFERQNILAEAVERHLAANKAYDQI